MNRIARRLIAALTLGAYFLLNTHLALALPSWSFVTASSSPDTEDHPVRCNHCSKKSSSTPANNSSSHDEHQDSDSPSHSHQGCPCDGDHCPVPGGCAGCNLAKIVGLTSQHVLDLVTGPVEVVDPIHDLVRIPPVLDGQVRPPRS